MIARIYRFLSRELSGLHEAAFLLGISAFGSAVLALLRDRLLAHTFGATRDLDIYYAAFSVPDFLNVTIASFVSVTVLIPFLVKKMAGGEEGKREANRFLSEILSVYALVMLLVSVVGYVTMPYLSRGIVPSFDARAFGLFVLLSRILLLQPFLLGLSNLFGGVTQSLHKFAMFALSPLLYNIGIICGVIFLYPSMGLPGLVWGVVLGATLHMAIQLPVLVGSGFKLSLTRDIRWREIAEVIKLSLPRSIGLGMTQLLTIALFRFASDMQPGSISLFQFADNLQAVPLGIIGVSYSTAAFPSLARLIKEGKPQLFARHVSLAVRHILYWSFFLSALVFVLAPDLVALFLGSGRFDASDALVSGIALSLFAFSIAPQGLLLLFTRSYYAAEDTAKPVLANSFSMILTISLALGLVYLYETMPSFALMFDKFLRLPAGLNHEVLVLPVAFSIGMIVNALLHWEAFMLDFPGSGRPLFASALRSLTVALLSGATVYAVHDFFLGAHPVLDGGLFFGVVLLSLVGLLALILFSYCFAWPELSEVYASLRSRVG